MAKDKCLTSFNDATGLNLSSEESRKILEDVMRAKDRLEATPGQLDFWQEAVNQLSDRKMQEAIQAKLNVLRNAQKRDGIMAQIKSNGGISAAADTLRSILHGSNKFLRDNVQTAWHSQRDAMHAAVENKLYQAGVKKAAESGAMDKDIANAWWRINNGEAVGNSPAEQAAQIYAKTLDNIRDRLNKVGATIGDARDYVTTTTYDPVRMRQAAGANKTPQEAFEAWWKKTEPRLSEKNFTDIAPRIGQSMNDARKEFGRMVYDGFVTGVHMVAGGEAETGAIAPEFANTSNIARQLSQHRVLLWKDSDSWNANMKEFSTWPTLHASVMMTLDRGTRSLALMDKLGTNPGANLNMLLRRIQETYRGDVDQVKKFQDKIFGIQNVMGRLDGSLNIPANMGIARFSASLRTWETVSDLGAVGITHFASIFPTVTSELAHHGINRLDAIGNVVKSLLTGMGDAQRREILSDLGAYADGAIRHVHSVIGDDTVPGRISKMAGRFMDMTGIHLVFDRTKAGVRDLLSHNLARNTAKSWDELEPHLSQMLGKYRITPEEWAKLKDVEMPTWNGRQYLTPSAAERAVPGISDKLLSYYTDAAAHGVVSPGVRERALLLGNTRPGTGSGEMLRFLTQFKMWPVAAMHQIIEREIYMSLSKKEAAWNIGKIAAIGIPAGFTRMWINDLAVGRPPRNPRDPKTILAAAAQSGGLGILGDYLFGETSRMGGGLVSTMGGPIVGDADSLVHIFNKWKEGEAGWPDLAHFGVRHVPFANLVYLKGALDYLAFYHLYEAASPGWWERTNRRLAKENGRTMTGYVPGGSIPYGMPGIYLGNNAGQSSGLFGNSQLRSSP